ncbi:glutamyl-tRNA reductase [Candidatus Hydrogenedentota bacterium]
MDILVAGLSHKTGPLDVRECLHFGPAERSRALVDLKAMLPDTESVVLSTCNRVEIYICSHGQVVDESALMEFLSSFHDVVPERFEEYMYFHRGEEAVRHLFRVISSLESMVVGEAEILGQVKDAYMAAAEMETTSKVLNTLFQRSFSIGKKVRSETDLGHGRVSVSSVAVDLAEKVFDKLSNKTAMVLGSGEMSELTIRNLVDRGLDSLIVSSRTLANAEEIAEKFEGKAVPFDEYPMFLNETDILISSTSAPHHIVRADDIEKALKSRRGRPMFFIDIALPRDISPDVGKLSNAYLYDLDDLQAVVSANIDAREKHLECCLEMVEAEVDSFLSWLNGLEAAPVVSSLRAKANSIRGEELERTLSKLPDLGENERREVEYMTERIVNKILHEPMTAIKSQSQDGDSFHFLSAVRELFGLKGSSRKEGHADR